MGARLLVAVLLKLIFGALRDDQSRCWQVEGGKISDPSGPKSANPGRHAEYAGCCCTLPSTVRLSIA